jgi:hypothetical protein
MNMNTIYFHLMTLSIFTLYTTVFADKPVLLTEEVLIELIKHNVWASQGDLQAHACIGSHINKGRRTIKLLDYCIRRSYPLQSENYLLSLVEYHRISFFHFMSPTARTEQSLEECKLWLLENIIIVKKLFDLKELDIKVELENACAFIQQLNEQYYKSLNIFRRLMLWRGISQWVHIMEGIHPIDQESDTEYDHHEIVT